MKSKLHLKWVNKLTRKYIDISSYNVFTKYKFDDYDRHI